MYGERRETPVRKTLPGCLRAARATRLVLLSGSMHRVFEFWHADAAVFGIF
jgi:hypothetical protein